MRNKKLLITSATIVAALLLVSGAGLWLLHEAGSSEEVTAETVLAAFQEDDDGTRDVPGAPAPGVYTYDAVGMESGGAASVKIDRALPPTAKMIVWQQPGGYRTRLVYSDDHLEGFAYTITDEGRALNWMRTRVSLLGSTSDDENPVQPEALWIPADPKKGDTWESTFDVEGDYTTHYASTVVGTETVMVGGESIETVVIERTTTYEGGLTGEWTDTWWWSPDLLVPVKMAVVGESKQGLGVFSQDSELTLSSTAPSV